jgi:hypothetical protein
MPAPIPAIEAEETRPRKRCVDPWSSPPVIANSLLDRSEYDFPILLKVVLSSRAVAEKLYDLGSVLDRGESAASIRVQSRAAGAVDPGSIATKDSSVAQLYIQEAFQGVLSRVHWPGYTSEDRPAACSLFGLCPGWYQGSSPT